MNGKCSICNKEGKIVAHHVNYFPEMLQHVCYKCHRDIHKDGNTALGEQFKEFNPNIMKQIWITDEAYEYVRKWAFDSKQPMGQLVSKALLNGMEE